jgi:hypothetical protein
MKLKYLRKTLLCDPANEAFYATPYGIWIKVAGGIRLVSLRINDAITDAITEAIKSNET